jgi:aldose 1-epimerase
VITQLEVPDRDGKLADIVLGFDDVASYEKSSPYFGAVIGRVANRISDACFVLEGKKYELCANNGTSSLHGGGKGWDKVIWKAEASRTSEGPSLLLTYTSLDGEEGYPGTVKASNRYTLTDRNVLKIEMEASTDRATVVNMAHHTYWNLAGHDSGSVCDHELLIHARAYTPADPLSLTVSGHVAPVVGTPFDFTLAKPIGKDLLAAGGEPTGFDTNWVVDGMLIAFTTE